VYTCDNHLSDRGFASPFEDANAAVEAKKAGLSAEEIAKVKEEWEERQKKKAEKEKEREKEKEKEKGKDSDQKEEGEKKSKVKEDKDKSTSLPGSLPSSPSPGPKLTHERYTLHRDYFASMFPFL
jgi:hypothetical protein